MGGFANSKSVVQDGLVFYVDAANDLSYPDTGTTWTDIIGGNDGTLAGGPTFDSSNGGSIDFDGVDDKVTTTLTSNTDFNSTFTMSLWFKQDDTDNTALPRLLDKSDNGTATNNGISVFLYDLDGNDTDSNIYVKLPSEAKKIGSLLFDVNTWYNLTIVCTDTQYKLYVNGGSATITAHTKTLSEITTSNGLVLGNISDSNRPLSGFIAAASMYSRELTEAENLQNYNALKNRFL